MSSLSQTPESLAASWDKGHISNKFPSDMKHADLKVYLTKLISKGIKIEKVGESGGRRDIYQMEWGRGPLKVFMWSQMHGDEPTATSALVDMFEFLHRSKDVDWVKRLSEKLTIRAVPMLNPDGADAFTRVNLQKLDVNRDAVKLQSPEARLLKRLRDEWSPAIGFNLHNQQPLYTAGSYGRQAAISLLVVFGDDAKTLTSGQERNRRITAAMITALNKFIPGQIGRYDDEWTPSAFGDNFSAWGTPTILIETGGLHGKDEMFLVKLNFIAYLTALNVMATGTESKYDPNLYLNLPENGSGTLVNYIFRNAYIVDHKKPEISTHADILAVTERRRASYLPSIKIQSIGKAGSIRGLDEYDASKFSVKHRFKQLKKGESAELYFYKLNRVIDWSALDLDTKFPPDAIFSGGKWIKGDKLVPKLN